MKTLIVEDDFTSRVFLLQVLVPYGQTHVAVNGKEAIDAFSDAIDNGEPYDLICLDIMMPEMDGQTVLKEMRDIEADMGILTGDGVKIIMTTALKDIRSITSAFREFCDAYLVKPFDKAKFIAQLHDLKLIE